MHAKKALATATAIADVFSSARGYLIVDRSDSCVSDMHGASVYVKLKLHVGSRATCLYTHEELPANFLAGSSARQKIKVKATLDVSDLRTLTPSSISNAVIEAIEEKLVSLGRPVNLWIATELDQDHTDLDQLQDRIAVMFDEPGDLPQLPIMIGARCGTFKGMFCTDPDGFFMALEELLSNTDMQSVIEAANTVAVAQDSRSSKQTTGKSQGDQLMDFFFRK